MSKQISIGFALLVIMTSNVRSDGKYPILEHGEVLNGGAAFELGAIGHIGRGEFSLSTKNSTINPNAYGVVLRDRNGFSARIVAGLLIAVASGIAQSGPKSVETESRIVGDYKITKTTTTYYSEAEKAAMRESAMQSIDALMGADVADFELQIFGKDQFGYGDSSGYKMNMIFGGKPKDAFNFQVGMGWGSVNSTVMQDGIAHRLEQDYFGMPFRFVGATSLFAWSLTWEWNWLAHSDKRNQDIEIDPMLPPPTDLVHQVGSHPLSFELETAILGRLYIRGAAVLPNFAKFTPGYRFSAGMRF